MTKTEWKAFLKSELESSEIKGIVEALLEGKDHPSVALSSPWYKWLNSMGG